MIHMKWFYGELEISTRHKKGKQICLFTMLGHHWSTRGLMSCFAENWTDTDRIEISSSQKTQCDDTMLVQYWPIVYDIGPAFHPHCVNISCSLRCWFTRGGGGGNVWAVSFYQCTNLWSSLIKHLRCGIGHAFLRRGGGETHKKVGFRIPCIVVRFAVDQWFY